MLDKAVEQAPADGRTVIHIAYETLHGPNIEFVRDRKIFELVESYEFGEKDVACIFAMLYSHPRILTE